jgi:hypothetical protein
MRWNLPDEKLFLFFPTEDSKYDTDVFYWFKVNNILEQRKWQDDLEKASLEYSLKQLLIYVFAF